MPPKLNQLFALIWWIDSRKRDVVALSLILKTKRYVGQIVNLTWEEFKTKQKTKERAKVLLIGEHEHELQNTLATEAGEILDPAKKIFSAEVIQEKKKTAEHKKLIKNAQRSQNMKIQLEIKSQKPIFKEKNFPPYSQKVPDVSNRSGDTVPPTSYYCPPPYIPLPTLEQFNQPKTRSNISTTVHGSSLTSTQPHSYTVPNFSNVSSGEVSDTATYYYPPPFIPSKTLDQETQSRSDAASYLSNVPSSVVPVASQHCLSPHTSLPSPKEFQQLESRTTSTVPGSSLTSTDPHSYTVPNFSNVPSSVVPVTSQHCPSPHTSLRSPKEFQQLESKTTSTVRGSSLTSTEPHSYTVPNFSNVPSGEVSDTATYYYPPPFIPSKTLEQENQSHSDAASYLSNVPSSVVPVASQHCPSPHTSLPSQKEFQQLENGTTSTVPGSSLTSSQPQSDTPSNFSNGQQVLDISDKDSTRSTPARSNPQLQDVCESSGISTLAKPSALPYNSSEGLGVLDSWTPELLKRTHSNEDRTVIALSEHDEESSQNSFTSRHTSDIAGEPSLDEHMPWEVTDRDVQFLENLLESVKKRRAKQKNETSESTKLPPISPDYFTPGDDKVEISPNRGFYLRQSRACYIQFKFEAASFDWKVLVRETLLEVYGSDIAKYSATGKRGLRPAIDYKLFYALFEWVNKLSPKMVDQKAYVNSINKITYNKRRCETSEKVNQKRSKQSASRILAAPTSTAIQGEEEQGHSNIDNAEILMKI